MGATSQHLPDSDDLEITSELPVLDEFSAAAQTVDDLHASTMPEVPVPAPASAPHVESELRSLSAKLAELQRRLDERGERLSALQAKLMSVQSGTAQTGALQVELTGARTAIALYEVRVRELEEAIRGRDARLQEAGEREAGLRAELARKDQDAQVVIARREAQLRMDSGRQELATARLYHDLEEARARSAAQFEALQSLETRRGLFEAQLQQLNDQLAARERKVGQLATEVDNGSTQAGELRLELEARALRITTLEQELASLSANLGRSAEESGNRAREIEQLRATVRELTDQATTHAAHVGRVEQEAVTRLQAQAQSHQAIADAYRELELAHAQLKDRHDVALAELAHLHAQSDQHVEVVQQVAAQHANRMEQIATGEARVRELTAQLRSRDHDLGEMTQTITDLKAQLEEARQWLQERDALMQRLETEAVHSQALVDNIKRSIRQLAPGTGATGPHEQLKEAARVLVRVENGEEIVHVLGRRTAIGRTADNDLQLDVSYISRHHALIMTSATQAVIEDLGSTNGVHVNGRKITRQLLKDGDSVLIGRMLFRYLVNAPAEPQGEPH